MAKSGPKVSAQTDRAVTTKQALVDAAVETLKADGFSGASARAIAARAGCNQALVFYHFDSVTGLLLAALDHVSSLRLDSYQAAIEAAGSPQELIDAAAAIFREDLDAGHVTVLVEMIAGSSSVPGLGAEVARRIEPWSEFARRAIEAALAGSPLAGLVPAADAAHAVVALYLGLEMLSHLDGDRTASLALFAHAQRLAALARTLGLGGRP